MPKEDVIDDILMRLNELEVQARSIRERVDDLMSVLAQTKARDRLSRGLETRADEEHG